MSKPRLLDLFCGAGGAAMGYARAGFEVVGVDIKPQPHYPFEFRQWDALDYLDRTSVSSWDAIHASPPCQRFSALTAVHGREHPDLIKPTRSALRWTGLPYVIENVPRSPLLEPIHLCGSMFGLGATCRDGQWRQLRRHRLFEFGGGLCAPALAPSCWHQGEPLGVYGNGGGQAKTVWNGGPNRGYMGTKSERVEAMGIDWMSNAELSQAIPPAYTEWIGKQLLAHLQQTAEAAS